MRIFNRFFYCNWIATLQGWSIIVGSWKDILSNWVGDNEEFQNDAAATFGEWPYTSCRSLIHFGFRNCQPPSPKIRSILGKEVHRFSWKSWPPSLKNTGTLLPPSTFFAESHVESQITKKWGSCRSWFIVHCENGDQFPELLFSTSSCVMQRWSAQIWFEGVGCSANPGGSEMHF